MPITPTEVTKRKVTQIPQVVFDAFDDLIVKHWDGHEARFTQDAVVELVLQKQGHATAEQRRVATRILFEEHCLDVEDSYRSVGWKVVYDKPAYCETYPATFTFKSRAKTPAVPPRSR